MHHEDSVEPRGASAGRRIALAGQASRAVAARGSRTCTAGIQAFCGWKCSGASGKGGLGPHYLPQFMREQSRTIVR